MDRARYKAAIMQIDQILWEDWDPIGVNDQPGAADEYASYAPALLSLLLQGASEDQVCDHLANIEVNHMGVTGSPETRLLAARRLLTVSFERRRQVRIHE